MKDRDFWLLAMLITVAPQLNLYGAIGGVLACLYLACKS